MNLSKYIGDLWEYEENYKSLIKEVKELNEWDIPFSWVERLNIINISVLPNLIHRFNIIPVNKLFHGYSPSDSKFYTERQKKPLKINTMLKEKSKAIGLIQPNFKPYYKAIVIKRVCCLLVRE